MDARPGGIALRQPARGATNFMQSLEGELDSSHVGFLHSTPNPEVKPGQRTYAIQLPVTCPRQAAQALQ